MVRVQSTAHARAAAAQRSVLTLFGRRLLGLPGTWLPAVTHPPGPALGPPWHYWWHAHVLDALVDAASREAATDPARAAATVRLAGRLLRSIRLRNRMRYVNDYYDDMAWLALAAQRLATWQPSQASPEPRRPRPAGPGGVRLHRTLRAQLVSAATPDLGGGLFWSVARDFKNVPATAPAALYFARSGEQARAQDLVDWLYRVLWDEACGLFWDGLRLTGGRPQLVRDHYPYNQGVVLAVLLTLAGPQNLTRATALVDAIADGPLALPGGVLRTCGGHDGGLFTGILVRHLAVAARSTSLPSATRARAAALVTETASALWAGRTERSGLPVFSEEITVPAARRHPPGSRIELSTQVQGWTVLEAAATVR